MLYIKILGMLLVVTASYGVGKTIGVYQNRRVEDIYELLVFVRMANGHLAYSASETPRSFGKDRIKQGEGSETGLPGWLCSSGRRSMLLLLSRSGQAVSEVLRNTAI